MLVVEGLLSITGKQSMSNCHRLLFCDMFCSLVGKVLVPSATNAPVVSSFYLFPREPWLDSGGLDSQALTDSVGAALFLLILCSLAMPETHSIDQTWPQFCRDPLASASLTLALKACATMLNSNRCDCVSLLPSQLCLGSLGSPCLHI